MPDDLYSVRMRAAVGGPHEAGGRHVTGAERLITRKDLDAVVQALFRRALDRGASPDFIRLTVERVSTADVARVPCIPVTTVDTPGPDESWALAREVFAGAGISSAACAQAWKLLTSPVGGTLRGAALLDAESGGRRDPDPGRGVRATHFDYSAGGRAQTAAALDAHGLGHFRTMEALAVAVKVLWSGVLAELCWSDEPDYVAGYVSTPALGYVRFPAFKPTGASGGRVFFVTGDDAEISACVERLERRCLLIDGAPQVRFVTPGEFLTEPNSRA